MTNDELLALLNSLPTDTAFEVIMGWLDKLSPEQRREFSQLPEIRELRRRLAER